MRGPKELLKKTKLLRKKEREKKTFFKKQTSLEKQYICTLTLKMKS